MAVEVFVRSSSVCGWRGRRLAAAVAVFFALLPVVVLASVRPASADPPPPPPVGSLTVAAVGAATFRSVVTGSDGNIWFATDLAIGRATLTGEFTMFQDPAFDRPHDLVAGSDGNLWFVNEPGAIGRITPAGMVTIFTDPDMHRPGLLVAGPDGNLWFTTLDEYGFGRITTAGVVTFFPRPGRPQQLAAGPDGNVWFTIAHHPYNQTGAEYIGYITPAGDVTIVPILEEYWPGQLATGPDGNLWLSGTHHVSGAGVLDHPFIARIRVVPGEESFTPFLDDSIPPVGDITSGPDGNLWYVSGSNVGRITMAGVATNFPIDPLAGVDAIANGPDGNLWIGMNGWGSFDSGLGKVTPAGALTMVVDDTVQYPSAIVGGTDGNLWFTNPVPGTGSISRLTPAGTVTAFVDPGIDKPYAITNGPGGDRWFTNQGGGGSVGRITHDGLVTTFADPAITRPGAIVAGSDGNVWFADLGAPNAPATRFIGRMTPSGTLTSFPAALLSSTVLVAAPDGQVWFSSTTGIRRISPAGVITSVAAGTPTAMTVGPDGNVWFTDDVDVLVDGRIGTKGTIGKITPAGGLTTYPTNAYDVPVAISPGYDGNLWFTQRGFFDVKNSIARMTTDGAVTTVTDLGYFNDVEKSALTPGADGNLWLTDRRQSAILRVSTEAVPGAPGEVTGEAGVPGSGAASVSWTAAATNGHAITGYTATATPGGATCTWTSGPRACTINGLEPGTAYTFTVTATNSLGLGPASAASAPVTLVSFSDVGADAPFFTDIEWLVGGGIATGYPDGTFRPAAPVTRQAMAAFLYRRAGAPGGAHPSCSTAPFLDVPVDAPFCGEIAWLATEGIAGGYPDGTFRPVTVVSRQAMAAFLYRSAGSPLGDHPTCATDPFADVVVGAPFCGEIVWLVDHDIANGYEDGTFRPDIEVSRQATAAFLHRLSLL